MNLLKAKGAQSPASEPEKLQHFPFSYLSFRCVCCVMFFCCCCCLFALAETVAERDKLFFVRDPLGLWGER